MNTAFCFTYDQCHPAPLAEGTIEYLNCVLTDRLGMFHPGDQFEQVDVDYHAGEVRLYDTMDDAVPCFVGRFQIGRVL